MARFGLVQREEILLMKKFSITVLTIATMAITTVSSGLAQVALIARGTLTGSSAGSYADLSGLKGTLENEIGRAHV